MQVVERDGKYYVHFSVVEAVRLVDGMLALRLASPPESLSKRYIKRLVKQYISQRLSVSPEDVIVIFSLVGACANTL